MNSSNTYGLKERDMETQTRIFGNYSDLRKVVLFGSRAKGVYHSGSDIDIAIMEKSVPHNLLRQIKSDISDSSLPYKVDLVDFSTLTNKALQEHILRVGKPLYGRFTTSA
jgi:predicted nucleotidyltransferase